MLESQPDTILPKAYSEISSLVGQFTPWPPGTKEPSPKVPEQLSIFYNENLQRERNDFFADLTAKQYTSEQIAYIQRSYPLMLSHELIGQVRKIDGTPYIDHPRAMAIEAARMQLDPTLIIASMLHDVPEDVKLGTMKNSEDWLGMIEDTYVDYEDKERLMRILRAEQKTETLSSLEDKEEVINYYANTPLGRRALDYLSTVRNGGEAISEEDKNEVATVLYDLNRLMSDSFIPNADGSKSFDPSLLTVKILDTWQNLQTPGFWGKQLSSVKKDAGTVTKLIRARILTNVAEMFGMREVASSMTENIAKLQNINDINHPRILTSPEERLQRSQQIEAKLRDEKELSDPIRKAFGASDQKNVFLQMPWADPRTVEITDGLPTPVWYITSNDIDRPIKNSITTLMDGYTLRGPVGLSEGALRTTLEGAAGRSFREYILEKGGTFYGKVKVGSRAPRMIHTLRSDAPAHRKARIEDVPERHIFHQFVTEYTRDDADQVQKPKSLEAFDTSMINLLEFVYSPREFLSSSVDEAHRPYLIIINGYYYLVTNNTSTTTIYEMAQRHGIQHPTVSPIGEGQTALLVTEGDTGILNRMHAEGLLPYNAVIVSEGASSSNDDREMSGSLYSH
ncbi:MAG: hypothetical protein WCJ70_03260 [bacterium]